MARKLTPKEVAALELEAAPAPGRKLSPEEVAQLGLDAEPPPRTSRMQAVTSALSQVPFGGGDELGAGLQAMLGTTVGPDGFRRFASPKEHDKEFTNIYRQARSENRQIDESSSDEHPGIYYPTLLGGSLAATMGGDVTAPERTLGALVKAGAKQGLKYGALGGFGGGKADLTKGELLKAALETGVGSLVGSGLGGALPLAGKAISSIYRGLVKPTEAAKLLRSKGVDLTIGQMSPGNIIAGAEEAGQSSPVLGKSLEKMRRRGREGWQQAVINETPAPGAWRPLPEEPAEGLAAAYRSYAPAYDAIRNQPIPAGGLRESVLKAAEDPAIYATPNDLSAAQRFLANEMGLIERTAPELTEVMPPPAPKLRVAPKPAPTPPPDPATVMAEPWQLPNAPQSAEPPLGALPRALQLLELGGGREATAVPERTLIPEQTAANGRAVLGPLPRGKAPPSKPSTPPVAASTRAGRPSNVAEAVEPTDFVPPPRPPRLSGSVDAAAILKARENIRAEIARRVRSGDETGAQLLRNAEGALTSRLEEGLAGKSADALRATDAQYGRYKVVEDAVRRGGDQPGGFTPAQLSQAVRASTQKGAYARGGGGALRDLAAAGRESLDTRIPPTGARLLNIGGALPAWLANTGTGKATLLGETAPQRFIQRGEDRLREAGLLRALAQYLQTRGGAGVQSSSE